eukprot:5385974-Amphidinium_carterae.8
MATLWPEKKVVLVDTHAPTEGQMLVCGSGTHGFKECTRFKNSTANPKGKPKQKAGNAIVDAVDVDEDQASAAAFVACIMHLAAS